MAFLQTIPYIIVEVTELLVANWGDRSFILSQQLGKIIHPC